VDPQATALKRRTSSSSLLTTLITSRINNKNTMRATNECPPAQKRLVDHRLHTTVSNTIASLIMPYSLQAA
jgi:hypothetical protein